MQWPVLINKREVDISVLSRCFLDVHNLFSVCQSNVNGNIISILCLNNIRKCFLFLAQLTFKVRPCNHELSYQEMLIYKKLTKLLERWRFVKYVDFHLPVDRIKLRYSNADTTCIIPDATTLLHLPTSYDVIPVKWMISVDFVWQGFERVCSAPVNWQDRSNIFRPASICSQSSALLFVHANISFIGAEH